MQSLLPLGTLAPPVQAEGSPRGGFGLQSPSEVLMIPSSLKTPARFCTLAASLAFVALAGCSSTSSSTKASVGQDDHSKMQLPPGWTEADMQACTIAGTPGKQHTQMAKAAGTWRGDQTMWMAPGMEPMKMQCTSTLTPVMDGRYMRCELEGEMPGMGPYNGLGYTGYDNLQQKYVSSWMDNHSSGIMNGTGSLSADGKTMTFTYAYMCPMRKKMTTMREVQHFTGEDTMKMEMFGEDPKSGKEFKMMEIDFTRTSSKS